jgi:hypothetical protein
MVTWFHSRDLKEVPFLVVLLIEAVAISSAAAAPQHWLRAVIGMSIGMCLGGFLRLVLSNDQAGLLRVRRKAFDVTFYWALGVAAFAFGVAVPGR